jgi:large subunit ribosomal protein L17
MRHRKKIKTLGRKKEHRKALVRNLVNDLLLHGKLQTTKAKAKVLRSEADRVITIAKKGSNMNTIRQLKSFGLRDNVSRRLMTEYVQRFEGRNSGFTTMSPVKLRKGDNALIYQISIL